MRRGEPYRVRRPGGGDPGRSRVFVVVSRQLLIVSSYSDVICAPVFSAYDGLSTQVALGVEVGLKHASSIHCDQLMNLPKATLTDYVGALDPVRMAQLDAALRAALELDDSVI